MVVRISDVGLYKIVINMVAELACSRYVEILTDFFVLDISTSSIVLYILYDTTQKRLARARYRIDIPGGTSVQ